MIPVKPYPLGDTPTAAETGGADFKERFVSQSFGEGARRFAAVPTGEKRPPRRGEWYLSGGPIAAYRAPNDLDHPYHIAKLVRATTTTHTVTTIEPI
jgi:hypothetical protein